MLKAEADRVLKYAQLYIAEASLLKIFEDPYGSSKTFL